MPTLKQISCSLELGSSTRVKEYDHRYTDGGVEAFVAVPDTQIPFHIRVASSGYIAPGLAVYVFMDGAYQCNRNRQRLAIPVPGLDPSAYEVDFKLRQKEEKTSEGLFVAREWTFAQLKTANADRAADVNPTYASNVGTIEVVVLRCKEGGAREDAVDPAHAVVDVGPQSRAASVVNAAPPDKPASVVKAASKVSAAKTPSVAKAPSKAASEADGFFGIFDGADDGYYDAGFDGAHDYDKYGYPIRSPSYVARRPPPPEYRWDTLRGAYRHVPPRALSPDLPSRVHESEYHSVNVQPRHSAPPEDIPGRDRSGRGDIVFIEESAKQIEELVMQGTEYAKRYTVMTQEANLHRNEPDVFPSMTRALQRKAQEITSVNQNITDLYRSIDSCMRRMDKNDFQQMRSFLHQQRIYPELQIELSTPIPSPTFRRVSLQSPRPRTAYRVKDDWQDMGSGNARLSSAERQQHGQSTERKQHGQSTPEYSDQRRRSPSRSPGRRRRSSSRSPTRRRPSYVRLHNGNKDEDMDGVSKWTGGSAKAQDNDRWATTPAKNSSRNNDDDGWGVQSAKKSSANNDDGWGNTPAKTSPRNEDAWANTSNKNNSRKNSAWDDTPAKNSSKDDDGWGNPSGSVKSASKSQKSGGWGDNASAGHVPGAWDSSSNNAGGGGDAWGADNKDDVKSDNNAGGWGGGGDDAQQNDSWDTGDTKNNKQSEGKQEADGWGNDQQAAGDDEAAGDGWGDQDAAKSEKKSVANDAWAATGGDAWGGGDHQPKSNQPSRKPSSAKPASAGGWGKQPSNNAGQGAWGNNQKPSSRAKSTHEKAKSQAAPRSFGNDGAQSRGCRDDAATTVSALRPVIKPYWQVWDKSPEKGKKPRARPRDAYVYPAPATVVAPSGKPPSVSHGVQAGRGAAYMHKLHQPEYLDTMQKPYAIFTFKYRSGAAVERIIKKKIDTSNVQKAVQEVEEERLMRLPKDELVAELTRRQLLSAPPSKAPSHASKLRDEWEKKAAEKKAASQAAWNAGWGNTGGSKKAPSKVASAWNAEVKPSDSVSNVAASRASKKKVDDWQQVGEGNAAAPGGWGGSKAASKAKTEEHWAADDPDMKQAGGDTW